MGEDNFLQLVVKAHQYGLETTIDRIRVLPEFRDLGAMAACGAIEDEFKKHGLEITPPIMQGEFDQPRVVERIRTAERFNSAYSEAIESGECQDVEYKESLYLKKRVFGNDKVPREHWVSEDLIFECIKTICAFLNSEGGTLLIGVDDNGAPQGVECELEFIPGTAHTLDSWELYFSSCLEKYIYDYRSCIGHISKKLINIDGKSVCVVIVRPRRQGLTVCKRPTQIEDEIVYVRNGNGSAQIKARAIEALVRSRLEK